jgi:hypothetical protein
MCVYCAQHGPQFQDLTCVKLKDCRVCAVRVTFANITLQTSILSTDGAGNAQIRWKDILRFEHVKVSYRSRAFAENRD